MNLLAGFLGLGRPTALALLASSLQLPEVFSPALGDFLPTLPSKLDGGGIFRFWQNSEEALSPCVLCMTYSTAPSRPLEARRFLLNLGLVDTGRHDPPHFLLDATSNAWID